MSVISDEQMKQLSDLIGQVYVKIRDAVGDTSTPGTATFESERLSRYAASLLPIEGLVSGFAASIPVDTSNMRIASGIVRYGDANSTSDVVEVSIARTFQYAFDATCRYGVVAVLQRSELGQSAVAARTSLATALTGGASTQVELADPTMTADYSVPFFLQVGSENIEIYAVDSSNVCLISPSYNGGNPTQSHASGETVYVNKPVMPRIIVGMPVPQAYSTDVADTFAYYPPVPAADYISIARGIVRNPNTVSVARTPVLFAIQDLRELVDVPATDNFTSAEAQSISNAVGMFKLAVNYQTGFGTPGDVLEALKTWSDQETQETFPNYWNDRPFAPVETYLRGESFWGISRLEFGDDFKRIYYDTYSNELLTTLAIFRGDIFGGQQTYGSPPSSISGSYTVQTDPALGNLSYGRWTYRVTAVTASGESSPSSAVSVSIPQSAGMLNSVELSWDSVVGALCYHVYRIGSEAYRFLEHRLTSDGEVVGTTYSDVGDTLGTSVRRGLLMLGNTLIGPTHLIVYVPPMSGSFNQFMGGGDLSSSYTDSDTITRNEMVVTIYGLKEDGTVGGPHEVTIPKGTIRGTKFAVGGQYDEYVGLQDVSVVAGSELTLLSGSVAWSPYDLFTIQNV